MVSETGLFAVAGRVDAERSPRPLQHVHRSLLYSKELVRTRCAIIPDVAIDGEWAPGPSPKLTKII